MLIYIARAISDPNPVKYLSNVAMGNFLFDFLLNNGYSAFWGGQDLSAVLTTSHLTDADSMLQHLQRNSLEIMKRCDAVVAMLGWEFSKGAKKEIEVAKEIGIPVFYMEKFDRLLLELQEYEKQRQIPVYKA